MAKRQTQQLNTAISMWEIQIFDLGRYSFTLQIGELPQEGEVIEGDMKILKLWDVDESAKTAKAEIEFTSKEAIVAEEKLDRFFAFLSSL